MAEPATALVAAALSIGVVHTLLGPDHYVPFVALARSREWSLRRALGVTAVCGVGHVVGSIVLGFVGIALGWAVSDMVGIESLRGDLAGWALLGLGLAYTAWGVRRALVRRQPEHQHVHAHADGTLHAHPHRHEGDHAHPHPERDGRLLGPWSLFIVFVLGPCEPLIPLLLVPAAESSWGTVATVALVFAAATIATMLAVVAVGALGLSRLPAAGLERWSHALAGVALAACGAAIQMGL